ncbi:MAG: hypothetical protein O3A96_14945 [Proteobacteria bacterium]|nr:hypothetical protein [Pseudomonadota bacterium]
MPKKLRVYRPFTAAAFLFLALASCNLPPLSERTFTFQPDRTASIFGVKQHDRFGVCDPFFLDRRGTRLYVWDEFMRQRESASPGDRIRDLAGYEVAVTRGQSCHLRIVDTYQAAAHFDLSSLAPGAVVTHAELRVQRFFSPLDAPRLRGNREQCAVMMIGQATENWADGRFGQGSVDGGSRPFIASRPARPDTGPHDARGTNLWSLDVTRPVGEWVRGVRPNQGFTITPDLDRVMGFYNATDEDGFMCDAGITGFELVVTAAVPGA